jgi:hypothetical protein
MEIRGQIFKFEELTPRDLAEFERLGYQALVDGDTQIIAVWRDCSAEDLLK